MRPHQAPTQKRLQGRPTVVVCEGSDETYFLKGLIRGRGLDPHAFDLIEAGGKNAIPNLLSTLRLDPQWRNVTRLAILRDANGDASAALQSVRETLIRNFGFAPELPLVWRASSPQPPEGPTLSLTAHVPILAAALIGVPSPDSGLVEGALESLCLQAIPPQHAAALQCADALTQCASPHNGWLDPQGRVLPSHRSAHDKARFQAYLAARGLSGRLGLALQHTPDLIDFGHQAFTPLTSLLTTP